jgi:hypothetical protein
MTHIVLVHRISGLRFIVIRKASHDRMTWTAGIVGVGKAL